MSNLLPGVSASDIPGNRPADEVFERWLDGRIGYLLMELAQASLPDIAGYRCKHCGMWLDPIDEYQAWEDGEGSIYCQPTLGNPEQRHEGAAIDWPPFDIEREVIDHLKRIIAGLKVKDGQ